MLLKGKVDKQIERSHSLLGAHTTRLSPLRNSGVYRETHCDDLEVIELSPAQERNMRDPVGWLLTQHQGGPAGDTSLQALVEDLMQEHDGLTERKSTGELLPGLPTSLGEDLAGHFSAILNQGPQ